MDKKAPRAPRPHEDEERTSMSSSTRGSNQLEAHARTRDFIQPLDYFRILGERTQTMSPPPVGLEKAIGPSTDSHPDTPAASTTSGFSRSSTINSSQTQDSDITRYSQDTSSSDVTISARSLSFPVMGGTPLNHNSLVKRVDNLFDFSQVLETYANIPAPKDWASPAHINTHFSWPDERDEAALNQSKQSLPSRHSTFPLERSRSQNKLDETYSSMSRRKEDPIDTDGSSTSDHLLPEAVITAVPDMHHNTIRLEAPPDEADRESLSVQTDLFLKGRFSASDGLVVGSLDRKHADLYCGFASTSSPESLLHQRRKFQRYRYKGAERLGDFHISNWDDMERHCSRNGVSPSAAGRLINSEAAATPESLRTFDNRERSDKIRESRSPSSSPEDGSSREESCEPCLPGSDDNTNCSDEASTPSNEDYEDLAYGKLMESITNLLFESSCMSNIEEKGVPVELYVHSLLEQIQNYRKPSTELPDLCLPIRSRTKQTNEVPVSTGVPNVRLPGHCNQGSRGGGGGGTSDTNKRVRDHEDDENPSFGSKEDHSSRHQQAKKLKTGNKGSNYSCPFRKRNPTRFNVREYENCALRSFQNFALLKRHIQQFHLKANALFSCIRCKTTFEDEPALNDHLLQLQGCQVRQSPGNGDPEDGITAEVSRALQARTREANISEWEPLWRRLFPSDNAAEIPDHEHEPPVELDEVQKHYYEEDSVHRFIQSQPADRVLTEHPFWYIVEGLRQCRRTPPEKPHPKRRQDQDNRFELTVRSALERREQPVFGAQQPQAAPEFAHTSWGPGLNNEWPFLNLDIYSNQPYPNEQPYRTHSQYGFDGVSHIPAPSTLYSSEGTARPAPPQPTTNFSLANMQNGRPSLTAEGSGHRSSGLSSQRSRDSGDLRTLRTEVTQETQNTQYTPNSQDPPYSQDPQYSQDLLFSQDQGAMLHHQQYHPTAEGGKSGDHVGACSCSTSPSGIPAGQHCCVPTIPVQDPSEHSLCGVGEGRTGAFMPQDGLVITNSDEEFSPGADLT